MELTPEAAVAKATKLYKQLVPRAREAVELQEFYEGKQPLTYATEKWAEAHKARYKDFADNWCEVVANSSSERESVIGFRLPSSTRARQSRREKQLHDAWLRNEQDSLSVQGFLGATVAKRAFCQVWGDPTGEPIITWKAAQQAIVEYDAETGRKRVASLVIWDDEDDGFEYARLSTVSEVWKLRRQRLFKAADERGFVIPANVIINEGAGWEIVADGFGVNHLQRVPVVEFPNRPVLSRGPLSDIQGTAAMQNAINLLWAYLFNAADAASMPARVVMGQEPPKVPILDDNGQKIGEVLVSQKDLTEGRMLWLTGQETTIGQWDAAKLDVFTEVIEKAVGHIAAQTRTPPHYLVANKGLSNLSGDALKAAETGLVQKVRQAQEFFEPRLRDVFELVALQLGEDKTAEEARLGQVLWKDPENRSDAQTSDAMLKDSQAGYPFEYLLERRGHSPQEIKRIMAMRQAELDAAMGAGVQAIVQGAMTDVEPDEAGGGASAQTGGSVGADGA